MAFPTGWTRRAAITIQSSHVSGSGTLSGFPMLLVPESSNGAGDGIPWEALDADGSFPAQNGGGDIRFSSDSAGSTQLPCEIFDFTTDNDPSNGSAEVWVRCDPNGSSDVTIYIWYNTSGTESQPAVGDTYGRNAVWTAYEAVLHLRGTSDVTDVTGNGYDIHTVAAGATSAADGPFGVCVDFDGTASAAMQATGNPIPNGSTDPYTVSVWCEMDSLTGNHLLVGDYGAGDNRGWAMWADNSASATTDCFSGHTKLENRAESATNSASTGTWRHVVYRAQQDGAEMVPEPFFINGADSGTVGGNAASTNADEWVSNGDLRFGKAFTGFLSTSPLNGRLAEARVRPGLASDDWLITEYNSQNSPETFVSVGAPESVGGGGVTVPIFVQHYRNQGIS